MFDKLVGRQKSKVLSFILSGKAKVVIDSPQGKEVTPAILSKDDFFGEMALIDRVTRSATVITLESTEALMIHSRDFNTTSFAQMYKSR